MEQHFDTREFPVYYDKLGYLYKLGHNSKLGTSTQNILSNFKNKILPKLPQVIVAIIAGIIATILAHPIVSHLYNRNISTPIVLEPLPNQSVPEHNDIDDIESPP